MRTELDAVKANEETPLSHLRNALMLNDAIDPMTQGAIRISGQLTDVGGRIRKAIMQLEQQERDKESYFAGVQALKVERAR